jgi:hypothetical protein
MGLSEEEPNSQGSLGDLQLESKTKKAFCCDGKVSSSGTGSRFFNFWNLGKTPSIKLETFPLVVG